MDLNNPPHTLYQKPGTGPGDISNRIFIDDFIHNGEELHDILNTLHEAGPNDTLECRINSSGGIARYGQQFINVMFDKFPERTLTVLEADALSVAALVFLAGHRRVIYPHSSLLFHDLSLDTTGKVNEAIRMLEAIHPIFNDYLQSLMLPFFSAEEINNISRGLDLFLNAKIMCERGIAHTVLVKGKAIPAEDYLESINKDEETSYSRQTT